MSRPTNPLNQQRLAYHRSRAQARFREEPWSEEFTFEQWWEIWQPFWSERGTHSGCWLMRRRDHRLPWSAANVELVERGVWMRRLGQNRLSYE